MLSLGNIDTTYRPFQHDGDEHRDCGGSGVCYSFDPGEKSSRTWTQPVRSHHHPFFPRGTLSKIEIRTFRGSTLGFNAYSARKLGLLTDNGSVPVDYYDSVVYRDNYVFILQESVVRLSVGRGVSPEGTSLESLRLSRHCGTPPSG